MDVRTLLILVYPLFGVLLLLGLGFVWLAMVPPETSEPPPVYPTTKPGPPVPSNGR